MSFRVLFKQRKQRDRRATRRGHSDQDAASSRDGRARRVARCWERRRRYDDDDNSTTGAPFATSPRLASAIFAPPRPQGRIGRVARAAACPARARKYNKRTKWSRVAPRSGRSTSRGGQNHPRKPIRPYPARPRSRSHPPRGIDPSHQYERALTVSFPPSDVAAVPRTSRVTRQPNSAGGAQSDDPAQQSEPAGTRHAPDPRDHAVARPGTSWSSRAECKRGLNLSHGMHVRRRWPSGRCHFGPFGKLVVFGCSLRCQERGGRPRALIVSCGVQSDAGILWRQLSYRPAPDLGILLTIWPLRGNGTRQHHRETPEYTAV